jgi:hypothetical protein
VMSAAVSALTLVDEIRRRQSLARARIATCEGYSNGEIRL